MVEQKVTAAAVGGAFAGVLLWILNVYVFDGQTPEAIVTLVNVGIATVLPFIGGYLAKHTPRPDLTADHDTVA